MQEILSHLKILRVFSPWIINLSKSVEQKSGSKQNCPKGHIHSNRQTLFQLLTHSQRKAVQIFSASQNGIWGTLLWTITRTSEWNQHINGPLGVLDDYTKNINIYVFSLLMYAYKYCNCSDISQTDLQTHQTWYYMICLHIWISVHQALDLWKTIFE